MADRPQKLLTPGPTSVPPTVLRALSRAGGPPPLARLRRGLRARAQARLREVFRTENEVLALHVVGHGRVRVGRREPPLARRARARRLAGRVRRALAEDRARVRRATSCRSRTRGARRPSPEDLARARSRRAAAATSSSSSHSETSTGVVCDLQPLLAACREAGRARRRRRGLEPRRRSARDGRVGGRRRRLRLAEGADDAARPRASPPSPTRAWERAAAATLPRFYWDWERQRTAQAKRSTPFTPGDVARRRARRRARAAPRGGPRRGVRPPRRARPRVPRGHQGDGARAVLAGRRQRGRRHRRADARGHRRRRARLAAARPATAITIAGGHGDAQVDGSSASATSATFDVFDITTALAAVELELAELGARRRARRGRRRAALEAFEHRRDAHSADARPRPRADRRRGGRAACARASTSTSTPTRRSRRSSAGYDAIVIRSATKLTADLIERARRA